MFSLQLIPLQRFLAHKLWILEGLRRCHLTQLVDLLLPAWYFLRLQMTTSVFRQMITTHELPWTQRAFELPFTGMRASVPRKFIGPGERTVAIVPRTFERLFTGMCADVCFQVRVLEVCFLAPWVWADVDALSRLFVLLCCCWCCCCCCGVGDYWDVDGVFCCRCCCVVVVDVVVVVVIAVIVVLLFLLLLLV